MHKLPCPNMVLQEEDGLLIVGFADNLEEPSSYLMLQRQLNPTAQDIRLGHDKVYVEIDDQHRSVYGDVAVVELNSKHLILRLEPRMAVALNSDVLLSIDFDLDEERLAQLRGFLDKLTK